MTDVRKQDGFALIEVIVSAAVLAIIALAVLSGIDGATASTARERARAVAASLAEQDQERMRGYRFDELANIPQQPVQVIQGVRYTVKSQATWVVDDGSVSATCATSGNPQKEYLRIVSTVSSELVGARIPEVKIESLVAAPVSGSLVVKVEPGDPTKPARVANVANLAVQVISKTDGRSFNATTNASGCAIFRSIEDGKYTVRLNTGGYVNRDGVQLSETETSVNAGIVNVLTVPYDKAVTVNVAVKTLRPGAAFPSADIYPSNAIAVTSEVSDARGKPLTYTPSSWSSAITATKVFPFKTGYTFYAGSCLTENPELGAFGNGNYFSATNSAAVVTGDPTVFQPQSATVYQPALNLRIRANSSNAAPPTTFDASTMRVYAWLQSVGGDACGDIQRKELDVKTWPATGWGNNPAATDKTRNWIVQDSTNFDPGLPFGTYKICLNDGNMWWATTTHYNNTKPSRATLEIPPTSTRTGDWRTSASAAGCA